MSSRPRRARISSTPMVGSSARRRSADPTPSSPHTTLAHQWTPYERYIQMSRRAEHRRVPRRLPAIGMACRVVWRVRLDFDDDAADTVHQERPSQELTRDGVDISREEGAGDAGGQKSCSVSVGLAVAASTFRALRPRSARSTRLLRGRGEPFRKVERTEKRRVSPS